MIVYSKVESEGSCVKVQLIDLRFDINLQQVDSGVDFGDKDSI